MDIHIVLLVLTDSCTADGFRWVAIDSNVEDRRHRRRRGRSLAFGQRLLFALHENVVERIVADRLRQALDPLQFVLLGGRRHSVDGMLALHHLAGMGMGWENVVG